MRMSRFRSRLYHLLRLPPPVMSLTLPLALPRALPVALLLVSSALMAPAAHAQPKTLDWPNFVVRAQLDSTGTLHVQEQQTMRFTGDWNGGERRFDVRSGQRIQFRSLRRVDRETGDTITLQAGETDVVDRYAFSDGDLLRWRSRLPSDPPFLDAEITYLLDYEYEGILTFASERYLLDHEFAFRDRTGVIEQFALTVDVDPRWEPQDEFAGQWSGVSLPPGEAFVVTVPFAWTGAGVPSGVWRGSSLPFRYGLGAVMLLGIAWLVTRFLSTETKAGRFAPMVPHGTIDLAWLREHVFSLLPEVAGTVWDDKVDAPEVSATLARMVGEGKLKSRVESSGWKRFPVHVLHLTLLVDRDTIKGYERPLVDKLFAYGETQTDTNKLRKRYASTGFDPAGALQKPLRNALDAHPESGRKLELGPLWRVPLALALVAFVLFILGGVTRIEDAGAALAACAMSAPVYLFASTQAYFWRSRVASPMLHALRFLVPLAGLAGAVIWLLVTGRFALGPFALSGLVFVVLAQFASVCSIARARYTPERMLFRKRLASARAYFARELDQPTPKLEDAWYPYLLAFGLGKEVDRWFRAFSAEGTTGAASASVISTQRSGSSGPSSADGSWGGFSGGGAFAGGGATVAFGAAVGAMSASVSAPSSSGSSGGGSSSSSGGSSGGGGGGGW